VQVPDPLKLPLPSLTKVTVPVGVVGVVEVSLTLAIHVAEEPTFTVLGEHETLVLVESRTAGVTVMVVVP
jgi:hypothetical protein